MNPFPSAMKPFSLALCLLGFSALALKADTPAPLRYTTTWIGNSLGGGLKWVQNSVEGMEVTADGTAYLASGWDEAGREFGIYKNGDVIGNAVDTHGWGTGGGKAVTANAKYLFIGHSHGNEGGGLKGDQYPPKGFTWFGVSRRNKDGSHAPFTGGKGRFGDMLVLHEADDKTDAQVRGLAVDEKNHLYVSDTTDNQIKVYDCDQKSPKKAAGSIFPMPSTPTNVKTGNILFLPRKIGRAKLSFTVGRRNKSCDMRLGVAFSLACRAHNFRDHPTLVSVFGEDGC